MNQYVTGAVMKRLREKRKLTQADLAAMLNVSDKTVSKWETGRGYPDITLLEPIAKALGLSAIELLSGNDITNQNRSANILKSRFYVCPVCGNAIHSTGEAVLSCCGLVLPPLEAEKPDEAHSIQIERVEDEYVAWVEHEMTKEHYLSFFAYVSTGEIHLVKCYPEGDAKVRFPIRGAGMLYYYCNRHGLYKRKI